MQAPLEVCGTWHVAMSLLLGEKIIPGSPDVNRASTSNRSSDFSRCAIRILERQSQTTATVAWSDSTACYYGEQLWRRSA